MVRRESCPKCSSKDFENIHDMLGLYFLCHQCGHFEDLSPRVDFRASTGP